MFALGSWVSHRPAKLDAGGQWSQSIGNSGEMGGGVEHDGRKGDVGTTRGAYSPNIGHDATIRCATRQCSVCNLHVGFDWASEGSVQYTLRNHESASRDATKIRIDRGGSSSSPENAIHLRRFGVGILLAVVGRGAVGGVRAGSTSRSGDITGSGGARGDHGSAFCTVDANPVFAEPQNRKTHWREQGVLQWRGVAERSAVWIFERVQRGIAQFVWADRSRG